MSKLRIIKCVQNIHLFMILKKKINILIIRQFLAIYIYVNIIFKHVCKIKKELFALHFIVLDYIIQLIPIILSHLVSQNNGGLNTV